jgi:hypothetical protein
MKILNNWNRITSMSSYQTERYNSANYARWVSSMLYPAINYNHAQKQDSTEYILI